MLGLFVYLISIIDSIRELSILFGIVPPIIYLGIMLVIFVAGQIISAEGYEKGGEDMVNIVKRHYKYIKIAIIVLVTTSIIRTAIPTSKALVAIYSVPKIITNEDIRELPGNSAKLLNDKLKDWIKDIGMEDITDKKDAGKK